MIKLFFEDGTSAECDVLIGADGIHSRTRTMMIEKYLSAQTNISEIERKELYLRCEPFWTGAVAYRGVFPKDTLQKTCPGHRAAIGPHMVSIFHETQDDEFAQI